MDDGRRDRLAGNTSTPPHRRRVTLHFCTTHRDTTAAAVADRIEEVALGPNRLPSSPYNGARRGGPRDPPHYNGRRD